MSLEMPHARSSFFQKYRGEKFHVDSLKSAKYTHRVLGGFFVGLYFSSAGSFPMAALTRTGLGVSSGSPTWAQWPENLSHFSCFPRPLSGNWIKK